MVGGSLGDALEQGYHFLVDDLIGGRRLVEIDKCDVDTAIGLLQCGHEQLIAVEPVGLACATAQQDALHGLVNALLGDRDEKPHRLLTTGPQPVGSTQWERHQRLTLVKEIVDGGAAAQFLLFM